MEELFREDLNFKVGDIVEGEYEVIKITHIGRENCLCDVIEDDSNGWEEPGDEVIRGIIYLNKRYGLKGKDNG